MPHATLTMLGPKAGGSGPHDARKTAKNVTNVAVGVLRRWFRALHLVPKKRKKGVQE